MGITLLIMENHGIAFVNFCGNLVVSLFGLKAHGLANSIPMLSVHPSTFNYLLKPQVQLDTMPVSVVGNASDCRSRGCQFDPGPVHFFRGD